MNVRRPQNDIVEIFGYAPNDTTRECRTLWTLGACPFVSCPCSKANHDKTVVYGTCSVTTKFGDCVICPNRLYANNFETLKRVSFDAFGDIPFYTYQEFLIIAVLTRILLKRQLLKGLGNHLFVILIQL